GVASTSGSRGHGMKSFMVAPLVIVIASRAMAASIRSVGLNGPFLSMYASQPMNSLYDICARSSPTVRPSASARSCSNSSVGVRLFFAVHLAERFRHRVGDHRLQPVSVLVADDLLAVVAQRDEARD